mgnify:CR=1 FL=1
MNNACTALCTVARIVTRNGSRTILGIILSLTWCLLLSGCQTLRSDLSSDSHIKSGPISTQITQARALLQAGDFEAGQALLEAASIQYPDAADIHYQLALIHWHQNRFAQSQINLDRVIELDPQHSQGLGLAGVLARQRGEYSQAEAFYEQSIALNSDIARTWYNLAVLHEVYLGQLEQAVNAYERYQALLPAPDEQVTSRLERLRRERQAIKGNS